MLLSDRHAWEYATHRNGTKIRFLPPQEEQLSYQRTLFPLHSLRVSLVTALALEGQVPFPILQKLVGHSRLLMTLYYTKPGATHIRDVLLGAAERLEAAKEEGIQTFLLDTEYGCSSNRLFVTVCHLWLPLFRNIPLHVTPWAGCRCTTVCAWSVATPAKGETMELWAAATTGAQLLSRARQMLTPNTGLSLAAVATVYAVVGS